MLCVLFNLSIKSDYYKVIKTIGEGTFGKVKLGIHIPTEERVILNIILGGNKNIREGENSR